MRGFTAHEARGRNLPLTSLKRAQRRFCCGNVPFFHTGQLMISVLPLGAFLHIVHAVKLVFVSVRRPFGFDLRFSEKLFFRRTAENVKSHILYLPLSFEYYTQCWGVTSYIKCYVT